MSTRRDTAPTPAAEIPAPGPAGRASSLIDTRVIYCGDNLEQLRKLRVQPCGFTAGRPVRLVDKMLALVPTMRATVSDAERVPLPNVVTATDQQIDALVYGLTGEEIKLVEGGA